MKASIKKRRSPPRANVAKAPGGLSRRDCILLLLGAGTTAVGEHANLECGGEDGVYITGSDGWPIGGRR